MDKRLRDKLYDAYDQELRFTKEDRDEVFEQIHKRDVEFYPKKKWLVSISKLIPLTVFLLMLSLCIVLFIPLVLQGDLINNNSGTEINGHVSQKNGTNGAVSQSQNDKDFTALFTVKDDENRIPVNLLLTYNNDRKMMKVLSIPRDTYAPIVDKDGTTSYDKMTYAYVDGSRGTESVRTTVSKLFELPIDYYAVMDLETFSTMIDSVDGIDYNLQKDIRVRAISTVAFEFQKGKNRLSGEEVLALLMDATVRNSLEEEDLLNLISAVINKTKNEIPETQLKQFTTEIEGNIPIEQLLANKEELHSIQLVSLIDGMRDGSIDEKYYITFEKDFLNSVSEELTTFN